MEGTRLSSRTARKAIGRRAGAIGIATLLSLVPTASGAHDHSPPRIRLRTIERSQAGAFWGSTWSNGSGTACGVAFALGPGGFPDRPANTPSRSDVVRIAMLKSQKPSSVTLTAWPAIHPVYEEGLGPGTRVETTLRRRTNVEGRRYWEVGFKPAFVLDNYLAFHVEWLDEDGCGPEEVSLGFWVRALGP